MPFCLPCVQRFAQKVDWFAPDTYARSLTPFLHRQLLELGLGDSNPALVSLADVPPRAAGR